MFDIITSFASFSTERNKEYYFALQKNIENNNIRKIHVLSEDENVKNLLQNEKLIYVIINKKPTFKILVDYINSNSVNNENIIITNADIFFDESISLAKLENNKAYCLTRWHPEYNCAVGLIDEITFWTDKHANLSFDSYFFKKPIYPKDIDFPIGLLGCDNRFAYELHSCGLNIINPSKIIKSYHVHTSFIRNYKESGRLLGNYLRVNLTDNLIYDSKNISVGTAAGKEAVFKDDWEWVPQITNSEYLSRKDIPISMKRLHNRDGSGKPRPPV